PGDVIVKFDGRDVPEMRLLPRMVAETSVDKQVNVVVWRKGQEVSLTLKLGELPDEDQLASLNRPNAGPDKAPSAPTPSVDALGMSLSSITPDLRKEFGIPDKTKGVVIAKVNDRSTAAERDLRPGDVIVEVAQEEVNDPAQIVKKVEDARKAGRKSVL